jgi:hypothetical protein
MNNIIKFTGKHISKEERERDRWVSLAFCACVIADQPEDERRWFLRELLKKFKDAPDWRPPVDDAQFPAFAVKMLLEVLTDETGLLAEAGRRATESVFAKFAADAEA